MSRSSRVTGAQNASCSDFTSRLHSDEPLSDDPADKPHAAELLGALRAPARCNVALHYCMQHLPRLANIQREWRNTPKKFRLRRPKTRRFFVRFWPISVQFSSQSTMGLMGFIARTCRHSFSFTFSRQALTAKYIWRKALGSTKRVCGWG